MARPPASRDLDRIVDRALRGLAYVGAAAVAAVAALLRTGRGRRMRAGLEQGAARAEHWAGQHSGVLDHWAGRALALLDRIGARWRS